MTTPTNIKNSEKTKFVTTNELQNKKPKFLCKKGKKKEFDVEPRYAILCVNIFANNFVNGKQMMG